MSVATQNPPTPRSTAFEVPCATCGDPITRVLKTDPATCAFCQRILGKRFDKALEPKVRQPKVRGTWTTRLHISKKIHQPDWMLSYNCIPIDEVHYLSGSYYPAPDTMLMMKEDYEEERKYARVMDGRRTEMLEVDFEDKRLHALVFSMPQIKGRRGKRHCHITKYSPERGVTQRHIKMGATQYV